MTLQEIDTKLHELRDLWIVEADPRLKKMLYADINKWLDKRLKVMGVTSIES